MYIQFMFIFIFNCIDVIFGILKAVINKNFKTSKMKKGVIEKAYIMLLYWTFIILENYLMEFNINITLEIHGINLSISKFYAFLTIINQLLSVFENISCTFPDILPKKLMELFEDFKNKQG